MNDTIRITYIGGPTVLLEFGGLRLLTDPTFDPAGEEYTTGPVTLQKVAGPAISAEEVGSLDYVLLTHDHHSDNLDRSGRALLAQAKMALTTEEGAQRLHGNSVGLKAWESRDLPAANNRTIRVIATPARHGPAGKERGSVNGYVFFFTDTPDQCVYISGDSVWYDGMAEVARRFSVQIAFLHLGAATVPAVGPFHLTMTAAEGVEAARAFSDATIVPLHFEGWAHFSEAKSDILRAFHQAGIEQRLRWPEAGRPIQLNF
jgi:L-ascorbate metabolism protein UlaG (beta-lactamase superfamily)